MHNPEEKRRRVVIIGAGFGGLSAVKRLAGHRELEITVIDRRNYHLFQPLLYQVAMAGLSPAQIAIPIRALLKGRLNTRVVLDEIASIDANRRVVASREHEYIYDWLIVATGANHSYFGNDDWEMNAPGLKTIEQATEIRRRVLLAFEQAEKATTAEERRRLLTFVIVGAGPTGVELAGALAEMSRCTLSREFRNIDPRHTRILLVEAGDRILTSFDQRLAQKAQSDLERMGVQVWTQSAVTGIDSEGVRIGKERIEAGCVIWAAGVTPSPLVALLGTELDPQGRVRVREDLSITTHSEVFVIGDITRFEQDNQVLPGMAPVALQQGIPAARNILNDLKAHPREKFYFFDKGQVATLGRTKAIAQFGALRIAGFFAWILWLVVHIYYLIGFKNRITVLVEWVIFYLTYCRGARLIVHKEWQTSITPSKDK